MYEFSGYEDKNLNTKKGRKQSRSNEYQSRRSEQSNNDIQLCSVLHTWVMWHVIFIALKWLTHSPSSDNDDKVFAQAERRYISRSFLSAGCTAREKFLWSFQPPFVVFRVYLYRRSLRTLAQSEHADPFSSYEHTRGEKHRIFVNLYNEIFLCTANSLHASSSRNIFRFVSLLLLSFSIERWKMSSNKASELLFASFCFFFPLHADIEDISIWRRLKISFSSYHQKIAFRCQRSVFALIPFNLWMTFQ